MPEEHMKDSKGDNFSPDQIMSKEAIPVIIPPTVGHVLLYWPGINDDIMTNESEPLPATVAAVIDNRCVNIGYLNAFGNPSSERGVSLIQPGDEVPEHRNIGYCTWMPYQFGQAAKYDKTTFTLDELLNRVDMLEKEIGILAKAIGAPAD